jgi:tetratricopeptide (TPR) repeat protein
LAGEVLQKEKKFPEALKEFAQTLSIADVDDNGRAQSEASIARCYQAMNDPSHAAEHFTAAFEKYPAADPGMRVDLLLSAGDMNASAGDRQAAERMYQRVLSSDQASPDKKKAAAERLAQLKK